MAKRKKRPEPGIPDWVVTYGDMMSLLLCFFILIVSFSEMKQPREYRKVLQSIREALGFRGGMGQADIIWESVNSPISIQEEQAKRADNKKVLNENQTPSVPGRQSKTSVVHEGNWSAVGGTLAFPPGGFDLGPDTKQTLMRDIAPRLRDRLQVTRIVGHAWGFEDVIGVPGASESAVAGAGAGAGASAHDMDHQDMAYLRAKAVRDFLVSEAGVNPAILRIEVAGQQEPEELPTLGGDGGAGNRRVQVYITDKTIDQVHPDPMGTGRGR